MIERQIVIGLITSVEFLRAIRSAWNNELLEASAARDIGTWCIDYFDQYHKAPGSAIQTIYFEKLRSGILPKERADDIESILNDLSEEFDEGFNFKFVLDETEKYFLERSLQLQADKLQQYLRTGELEEAKKIALDYKLPSADLSNDLDLSNPNVLDKIDNAFSELSQPLLQYPKALGELWNAQMVRGGFIGLMGPEKRGKSFWLLDMAIRARVQGSRVAFFQAGDMTEFQQLKRLCSYLTRLPTDERYVGKSFTPEADCVRNQLDLCDKAERECDFGPFIRREWDEKTLSREITMEDLVEAWEAEPTYSPCTNCKEYMERALGTPWIRQIEIEELLTAEIAKRKIKEFFIDKQRKFRISTHPNDTLSVSKIKGILAGWRRDYDFIPDVIIIDYADLLISEKSKEFRHQQNQIWKELRGLSQESNALAITATQADAQSYKQRTLNLSNYSEDKRKYGHVTAMYGLNQDKKEKQIGIMRINELVIREGQFDTTASVTVLQSLNQSRPFLGSYKSR